MLTFIMHILSRGGLHIVASFFVVTLLYFVFQKLEDLAWSKLHHNFFAYLMATFAMVSTAAVHEIYDVYTGADPFPKAYTDVASWFIGAIIGAYLIYRIDNKRFFS